MMPPDPIAFQLGPLAIYWYGLFLVLAVVTALMVISRGWQTAGRPIAELWDLAFVVIVGGILGARLYYVIYAWAYYTDHLMEIWQPWRGGLAIHGAWIGGVIAAWGYAYYRRWRLLPILDQLVVGLPLAQAIGRFGNFFNQELFGRPTSLPWGIPINPTLRPPGFEQVTFFHPTFFYEAILNIGLFFWLWWRSRQSDQPAGLMTVQYILGYSVIRFSMEFLRLDYSPIIFGVRWAQLFSAILIVGAGVGWYCLKKRSGAR